MGNAGGGLPSGDPAVCSAPHDPGPVVPVRARAAGSVAAVTGLLPFRAGGGYRGTLTGSVRYGVTISGC